jgi:hypothetical protein
LELDRLAPPVFFLFEVEIEEAYSEEHCRLAVSRCLSVHWALLLTFDPVSAVDEDVGHKRVHVRSLRRENEGDSEDPVEANGTCGRPKWFVACPEAREGQDTLLGQLLFHTRHSEGLSENIAKG